MELIDKLEKEMGYTAALAVKNFLDDNSLTLDDVSIYTLKKDRKVLIQVHSSDWNIQKNRDNEKTIYHGWHFDVFTWTCQTRSSGVLEYDDVLTDEYKYKCSE